MRDTPGDCRSCRASKEAPQRVSSVTNTASILRVVAAVGWKLFLLSEMSDVVLLGRSFRVQEDFGGEDLDVPFVHCAVPARG
jgi:hypothetical protein